MDPLSLAWDVLSAGWAAGGLSFILFAALFAALTDRIVSGKRHIATIDEWRKRTEVLEGDYKERLRDSNARAEQSMTMLIRTLEQVSRATTVAERVVERASHPPAP